MKSTPVSCPGCSSAQTASRRELFHQMMAGSSQQTTFSWYDEKTHHAFPPKSIFIILFLPMFAVAIAAVGFLLLGQYQALLWLSAIAGILLASLLGDFMLTYSRYQNWAAEWLCGNCQRVFFAD